MVNNTLDEKNVLLIFMPFWTPLIPPQGIAHLKTYLSKFGYKTILLDASNEASFLKVYKQYFKALANGIPEENRGNFYNIGHDVLRNHLIYHIFSDCDANYISSIKDIIYKTYYIHVSDKLINELKKILTNFYRTLKNYIEYHISENKPATVGLSVVRDNIGPSVFALKKIKQLNPSIQTVIGGSIFSDHLREGTPNFNSFLEHTPFIDRIVIGEGQEIFLKILQKKFPSTQKVLSFTNLKSGLIGFSKENLPDLSDFNLNDYYYLAAQGSKSCPNNCSFCTVRGFWGEYEEKDIDQTVDEMSYLMKEYKKQLFFMNDSLLNNIATPLSNKFIEKGLSIYWDGYLRVSKEVEIEENTLLWRRGGMYRVRLGTESGSQRVLDLMDKKITVDEIGKSLYSLASSGIKTTTYWVIGHPGETDEDFEQTLAFIKEYKNFIYEAECNPFIFSYQGQGKSRNWSDKRVLLYPELNIPYMQDYNIDCYPSREEKYKRVFQFANFCNEHNIPNPYNMSEIYNADKRWKKLHKNAVPTILEFQEGKIIEENKKINIPLILQNSLKDDGDFNF